MKWLLFLIAWLVMVIANAETLIIGASAEDPPFSSSADKKNHFYGFEIDLMTNICRRINAQCQFKTAIPSQIINDLATKRIDLAISAIIIPSNGTIDGLLFSLPYLPSSVQFITKKGSDVHVFQDIKNKRVGFRLGTLFHGTMFKAFAEDVLHSQITSVLYLTMNDLLYGLMNDKVDVVLSNTEPIKYWYWNNTDDLKLVGQPIPFGNGYAILGTVGQEQLMYKINQAIVNLEKDGTYEKLYNNYFNF